MKYTKEELKLQMQFGKILVFSHLLLETLDDPIKNPTKETKEIINKLKDLENSLEKLSDKFNIKEVQGSTFYLKLQEKILFNFKKAYQL